jgi:signal transduction histidine kinase
VERTALSDESLIALNRAVTAARLLSGAVHEVNNALQVISWTVEMLEREDLPPQVRESMERMHRQSGRASAALGEVLRFTKAPLDDQAPVHLRETAAHAVSLRSFAANRAGLKLEFSAAETEHALVKGSRALIEQAILNLIINAEQALAGTRGGTIRVVIVPETDYVGVRVSDEGPGVKVSPLERVFEPFVTTKRPWDGAGLGLWSARSVVEQYGGTLEAEIPDAGASFLMRLPRVKS